MPFPPPGDLPDPGIKPGSPALQADSLPLSHQGSSPKEVETLKFLHDLAIKRASLVAQLVKNPPAMRETWVRFLGWEDPLEKG